jgi:hypothetical protein
VGVYRLVATGTLEEAVYRRQIYKQQQANMSLAGTREKRFFLGVQVGVGVWVVGGARGVGRQLGWG